MAVSNKEMEEDDSGTARLHMIDPAKGYVIDNIEFIHKDIEAMMGGLSTAEFIHRCFMVAQFQTERYLAGETTRDDIREVVRTAVERLTTVVKGHIGEHVVRPEEDLGGNVR